MSPRLHIFALIPALVMPASAVEAPPEKAIRYHAALLKRPQNAALFDRFYGAWIDEQAVETLEKFLISRAAENGGQDWSVLARYQMRRGQEEGALESLGKAMEAVPDDVTLPLERARIRLRRLEFETAREDLAKVAAGKDAILALEAAKLTGKSWLREGKPEEAVKAWDALLAKHPGDEDLLEDLVESAAAEGETAQALAYVEKLIGASADPYKKTLRALRRGDLLAQSGKVDEAVEAYAATLEQVGEGSWLEREVLAQIESVFRKQDRLDDLAAELQKLADANPRRLLIHRQLAKLEAGRGEMDSAIGRFREVLKRSPGDRELREEFVRLLSDGERFDDAAEELEKMIELAPADSGLQLQMASLRFRQGKPEAVLAALEKARGLMEKDEGNGIRIAGLMLQYGQNEAGEALLRELVAAPDAGPAPAEALAAQFARDNRKDEALELLKKAAVTDDVDVLVRVAGSVSALGESKLALEILAARAEKFSSESRFLATLAQTALAADQAADAVPHAVRLVRLSKQTAEIGESVGLATRVLVAAEKVPEWRATLDAQPTRTAAETCLLAALAEGDGDFLAVEKLLELATDPLVVHFYAAMLDRRGEFELAIATLSRLADTYEGRKAAFFKDLSELQQRAGKIPDALATVERWKQSAPGDKSAWIAGSRLLRESGKPEEAVKMTRQAVARFEGDTDLAASLASLHEEAGQWADAEALYWRLYDEGQTPADQARWAAQLAQLAMRTGRTESLDEKLQERARGNRRSIGPILAQAELARVTQKEDKRRDLLLEAVRLQPKDVDLRLQIANLEEQSGNPDRVVALLEEAVAEDSTGRIRAALAQAYLRQGQVMKGMRELQAISGKQANDPRAIESSAATLAGAGLYEEAISFLREALPDGGDWRTRYLLAVMLEHDGREQEALPYFLALQRAEGELPGLTVNAQANRQLEHYPKEVRGLMGFVMASQQAYVHRDAGSHQRYGWGQGQLTGPFALPQDAAAARAMALAHLGTLAKKGRPELLAQMEAVGVANAAFMGDLAEASGNRNEYGQPDYAGLLKTHPQEPGLLELVVMFAGHGGNADIEPIKKILENSEKLSPQTRYRAGWMVVSRTPEDDMAWTRLIAAAGECIRDEDVAVVGPVIYGIIQQISAPNSTVPESRRDELKALILEFATAPAKEDDKLDPVRLAGLAVAGSREQWIDAFNAFLIKTRAELAKSGASPGQMHHHMHFMNHMRGSGQNPFQLPTLERLTLTSIPPNFRYQIRPKSNSNQYGGGGIEAVELLKWIDRVESPVVRAWIAFGAEDDAAAEKALAATPPKEETTDVLTLRAYQAIKNKNFSEAYKLLEQTRAARSADRGQATQLALAMVAVASEMKPEERAELSDSLRGVLFQCRQILGTEGAPMLAAKATQLGFEELAQRFAPPSAAGAAGGTALGPAGFSTASGRSSSGGNASLERMEKFASEGKLEAAAREAMLLLRQARAQRHNSHYYLRELRSKLSEEMSAELLKIMDPGNSKSLTKRLEYADTCSMLGHEDKALEVFTQLAEERPDDISITARMVFIMPREKSAEVMAMMTRVAESSEFVDQASDIAESLRETEKIEQHIEFFETVGNWLASAPPDALEKANLTWVTYHGKQFFQRTRNLPDLMSEPPEKQEDPAMAERRTAAAKQLALAALRHPSIAEEGFRLLSGSKAWEVPPGELDSRAREVLAGLKLEVNHHQRQFFTMVRGNGGSSSGEPLESDSSVSWLTRRLAEAKSPDEILPPDYLKELKERNPAVSGLVSALAGIANVEELAKLWDDEGLKSQSPGALMLRQGVLQRAGAVPGATGFLLARLGELTPGALRMEFHGNPGSGLPLIGAALAAGASAKDQELDSICQAISKAMYGEDIDWNDLTAQTGSHDLYQSLNAMGRLLQQQNLDPAAAARIHRAFYRNNFPTGSDEYTVQQTLRNQRPFSKPEEAEAFLGSLGCFAAIDTWEPIAAWIVKTIHGNAQISFQRESVLMNAQMPSQMNFSFSRSDLLKRLREREPATFGTLITAASFVSGRERNELTASAFSAAGPALAKLPADRAARISMLLPWLAPDALAKLPPAFQKYAKASRDIARQQLEKSVEDFLSNPAVSNRHGDPFQSLPALVGGLAEFDLQKAVDLALEAERRFTTSLSQGGRLSNYTSSGFVPTSRDQFLGNLMSSDSALSRNPAMQLRFLAALLKTPEGGRFSLADPNYSGRPILARLSIQQNSGSSSKAPSWARSYLTALAMPEEVMGDALVAVTCREIFNSSSHSLSALTSMRKQASEMPATFARALPFQGVSLGIRGWAADSAEGKLLTSTAITTVLADDFLSEAARMQLTLAALAKEPRILENPAIAESVSTWFGKYCEAERSAVNPLPLAVIKSLASAEMGAETVPFIRRIHDSFWKNAGSAKSGGHPAIPADSASSFFIVAARAGDATTAQRLLGKAKISLGGDLQSIVSLIVSGQFEHAKALLPALGRAYRAPREFTALYTENLEKSLAEFSAHLADPLQFLRLECQLLQAKVADEEQAPRESLHDRHLRLAAAYQKNPPQENLLRMEMLAAISPRSLPATGLLRDELAAIAAATDFAASIRARARGTGSETDLNPRYAVARLETQIVCHSALEQLQQGDPEPFGKVVATLVDYPVSTPPHRQNADPNILRGISGLLFRRATMGICSAFTEGDPTGFKKSLDSFEALAATADARKEFSETQILEALALCQFLACWTEQPERFTALLDRFKTRKDLAKKLAEAGAIRGFGLNASRNSDFASLRGKFLETAFATPSLGPLFPPHANWLDGLSQDGMKEDLLALADPLPADFIPQVRAPLMFFRARSFLSTGKRNEAIAAFRTAVDECPPDEEWNAFRGASKYELASALRRAKQVEEAKTVFKSIQDDEVGSSLKSRYNRLAKSLELPQKK